MAYWIKRVSAHFDLKRKSPMEQALLLIKTWDKSSIECAALQSWRPLVAAMTFVSTDLNTFTCFHCIHYDIFSHKSKPPSESSDPYRLHLQSTCSGSVRFGSGSKQSPGLTADCLGLALKSTSLSVYHRSAECPTAPPQTRDLHIPPTVVYQSLSDVYAFGFWWCKFRTWLNNGSLLFP